MHHYNVDLAQGDEPVMVVPGFFIVKTACLEWSFMGAEATTEIADVTCTVCLEALALESKQLLTRAGR